MMNWGIALVALAIGAEGGEPDSSTALGFQAFNADTGSPVETYFDYLEDVNLCYSLELEADSYPDIPNEETPWELVLVWVPPVTGIAVEEPGNGETLPAPEEGCGKLWSWR